MYLDRSRTWSRNLVRIQRISDMAEYAKGIEFKVELLVKMCKLQNLRGENSTKRFEMGKFNKNVECFTYLFPSSVILAFVTGNVWF